MTITHELNHFFMDEVHICACGNPESVAVLVLDILRCTPFYEQPNRDKLVALLPSDGLFYLVLGVLDHVGLIEHGGGIGGSWLTDKGKEILAKLEKVAATDPEMETVFPDCGEDIPEDCQECYPPTVSKP